MDRGSSDAPPNMSSFPVPGSWSEENAGAVRGPPAVWILAANTVPMIEHVTAAQGTWAIWPPEPTQSVLPATATQSAHYSSNTGSILPRAFAQLCVLPSSPLHKPKLFSDIWLSSLPLPPTLCQPWGGGGTYFMHPEWSWQRATGTRTTQRGKAASRPPEAVSSSRLSSRCPHSPPLLDRPHLGIQSGE